MISFLRAGSSANTSILCVETQSPGYRVAQLYSTSPPADAAAPSDPSPSNLHHACGPQTDTRAATPAPNLNLTRRNESRRSLYPSLLSVSALPATRWSYSEWPRQSLHDDTYPASFPN